MSGLASAFSSMKPHQTIAASSEPNMGFGLRSFLPDYEDWTAEKPVLLSGHKVEHVLVRNGHSTTLAAGQALTRDSDNSLTDVKPATQGDRVCGFVPKSLASVAVGAAFLMVKEGPTSAQKGTEDVTNLAPVIAFTNGRVLADNSDVYLDEAECGWALETKAGAAGTLFRIFARCLY